MAKIKAVYGKVAPLQELTHMRHVTSCLGTVRKVEILLNIIRC